MPVFQADVIVGAEAQLPVAGREQASKERAARPRKGNVPEPERVPRATPVNRLAGAWSAVPV